MRHDGEKKEVMINERSKEEEVNESYVLQR